MTQCILSSILSDTYQINRNHLELFYNDCLNQDEILNELTTVQEDNIDRRQSRFYQQTTSNIEIL